MYTTLINTVGYPLLIASAVAVTLHCLAKLFLFSSRHRASKLFAQTPWLPLRFGDDPLEGTPIEFSPNEKITLRGTLISHRGQTRKGVILFLHELNGNQSHLSPYVDRLTEAGFDLMAFDFRNHGKSDGLANEYPTPWLTTADLEDAKGAVRYLKSRSDIGNEPISVFGLGKGATVALCLAGNDSQVQAVVLDAPIPENRLFEKNCWELLLKSTKLSHWRTSLFLSLLFKAVIYSLCCPFFAIACAWQRFVLGIWFGCHFVNPWPFVRKIHQPIMIVHGHADSKTRADQIQAFCDRMPVRPKLWIVPYSTREGNGAISDDCSRQVARFFEDVSASA